MRNIKISKNFNKFKLSFLERKINIEGNLGITTLPMTDNIIELSKNKYLFKSAREVFLFRSLLLNTVSRSYQVYFKKLLLKGIGFKCYKLNDNIMLLKLGFTHKIYYIINKANVNFICKKGKIFVYGTVADAISNTAHELKSLRYPDSYKGKGIIFSDEVIKLKSGKKRV